MAPCVEHHTFDEGLPARGYDDGIVFMRRVHSGYCQVKVERSQVKLVKTCEQVIRPVVAQAALAQAAVDEEIMQPSRSHGAIFTGQNCGLLHRRFGETRGLIGVNGVVQLLKLFPQEHHLSLRPGRGNVAANATGDEQSGEKRQT